MLVFVSCICFWSRDCKIHPDIWHLLDYLAKWPFVLLILITFFLIKFQHNISEILGSIEELSHGNTKITLKRLKEFSSVVSKQTNFIAIRNQEDHLPMKFQDITSAFIQLRTDVEKRLEIIADKYGVSTSKNIFETIAELKQKEVFQVAETEALLNLIKICNDAIHGGGNDSEIIEWVNNTGYSIVKALDERIGAHRITFGIGGEVDPEEHRIDVMYREEPAWSGNNHERLERSIKYMNLWMQEQKNLIDGVEKKASKQEYKKFIKNQKDWDNYIKSFQELLQIDFGLIGSHAHGDLNDEFRKMQRERALVLEQFTKWLSEHIDYKNKNDI